MNNASALWNVQVRVSSPAPGHGLSCVQNMRVSAGNANRAKGLASLQTQYANPGCSVVVVDCWAVQP